MQADIRFKPTFEVIEVFDQEYSEEQSNVVEVFDKQNQALSQNVTQTFGLLVLLSRDNSLVDIVERGNNNTKDSLISAIEDIIGNGNKKNLVIACWKLHRGLNRS